MDEAERRLTRLEEAAGFQAHETDELGEAVRDLGERVLTLARRLERLEARLASLETPEGGEPDAPSDEE